MTPNPSQVHSTACTATPTSDDRSTRFRPEHPIIITNLRHLSPNSCLTRSEIIRVNPIMSERPWQHESPCKHRRGCSPQLNQRSFLDPFIVTNLRHLSSSRGPSPHKIIWTPRTTLEGSRCPRLGSRERFNAHPCRVHPDPLLLQNPSSLQTKSACCNQRIKLLELRNLSNGQQCRRNFVKLCLGPSCPLKMDLQVRRRSTVKGGQKKKEP